MQWLNENEKWVLNNNNEIITVLNTDFLSHIHKNDER